MQFRLIIALIILILGIITGLAGSGLFWVFLVLFPVLVVASTGSSVIVFFIIWSALFFPGFLMAFGVSIGTIITFVYLLSAIIIIGRMFPLSGTWRVILCSFGFVLSVFIGGYISTLQAKNTPIASTVTSGTGVTNTGEIIQMNTGATAGVSSGTLNVTGLIDRTKQDSAMIDKMLSRYDNYLENFALGNCTTDVSFNSSEQALIELFQEAYGAENCYSFSGSMMQEGTPGSYNTHELFLKNEPEWLLTADRVTMTVYQRIHPANLKPGGCYIARWNKGKFSVDVVGPSCQRISKNNRDALDKKFLEKAIEKGYTIIYISGDSFPYDFYGYNGRYRLETSKIMNFNSFFRGDDSIPSNVFAKYEAMDLLLDTEKYDPTTHCIYLYPSYAYPGYASKNFGSCSLFDRVTNTPIPLSSYTY